MHINAKYNEYARALTADLFDTAPKAVIAAVAVSSLTNGGDHLAEARQRFLYEWDALWMAGIVPQEPPRRLMKDLIPDA